MRRLIMLPKIDHPCRFGGRVRAALVSTGAALLLTSCQHSEPGIEIRTVEVAVPVACVSAEQIPAEPAKIGDGLTGDAVYDLSLVAESALELRKWGQELNALLAGCTG